MNAIEYKKLSEVDQNDFILLLNNQKLREHLMEHKLFDTDSVSAWINSKIEVDSTYGCRVRAVIYNNRLAGWCGIQLEEEKYEIAIVIGSEFWGIGKKIFKDIMHWAKALGHEYVYIHFLHTRPEYKFLHKIATNVSETELFGNKFITYQLGVK